MKSAVKATHILAGALFFSLPAAHAQITSAPSCADPFTQADVNMCAKASHEDAEKKLDIVFQQIVDQYQEQDRASAELGPQYVGAEMLIRASQKTWAISRDDFCGARSINTRGGSMRMGVVFSCLAMLTRSRTEELSWLLE